jgi:hypothetical protein
MKKIVILTSVCIVLAASATWAQRGPGGGMGMGRGMGMGPGPMGRGPILDQQAAPGDDLPPLDVKQPAPGPRMNRPQGNPQDPQFIPPMVREWLRNGGWAILRERFAQRMQMGQGPRAGMGREQGIERPQGPGMGMGRGMGMRGGIRGGMGMQGEMGMGMRGREGQGPGPGMRGQMPNQPQLQPEQKTCPRCQGECKCPCCQPGMQGQGPMQGRGRGMGPMAGMGGRDGLGGMGMMRGFQQPQSGGPEQDQWQRPSPDQQDQLKFRPEIKRFDGLKEKGAKGDQPKAKRDNAGKDKKDKKDKLSKGKKKADKEDEGDDDEEDEDNEKENENTR